MAKSRRGQCLDWGYRYVIAVLIVQACAPVVCKGSLLQQMQTLAPLNRSPMRDMYNNIMAPYLTTVAFLSHPPGSPAPRPRLPLVRRSGGIGGGNGDSGEGKGSRCSYNRPQNEEPLEYQAAPPPEQ